MYDITIIGAGPAGSTLARLLGKRYRVLVIDRRQLSEDYNKSSYEKCCGGLLAPDAQNVLARMGLGVPLCVLAGPQLFTVRTIDMHHSLERYYQRHYINVDREKFDRWLVSLIPPRVDIRCGCLYRSCLMEGSRIAVRFTQRGKEYTEHTGIIVGADGAFSRIRKEHFPEHRLPALYIGVQEWFRVKKALPYYSAIFDRDITDFYSWTIPKGEFLIVGSALLPGNNTVRRFQLLKERLSDYGISMDRSIKTRSSYLFRPVRADRICTGRGNIALIGEAAGWISPSSAEGLSYSFKSALALARALQKSDESFIKRYSRYTSYLKRNIVLKNLKSPFMYNSLLRRYVMKSGIQSMDIYER